MERGKSNFLIGLGVGSVVRYLWWYIQSLRGDYEEIGYRSYFR